MMAPHTTTDEDAAHTQLQAQQQLQHSSQGGGAADPELTDADLGGEYPAGTTGDSSQKASDDDHHDERLEQFNQHTTPSEVARKLHTHIDAAQERMNQGFAQLRGEIDNTVPDLEEQVQGPLGKRYMAQLGEHAAMQGQELRYAITPQPCQLHSCGIHGPS
jgi:hypothetical protein